MKTEFDYGRQYAQFLEQDCGEQIDVVDIDKMLGQSCDIPDADYHKMKRAGIANPDARKYWEGYNSYFK